MSAFSDGHEIEYKIGEFVSRPNPDGPLAIFDSISNLLNFMPPDHERCIFECEYMPSSDLFLWKFDNAKKITRDCLPNGSILAEYVKLTVKVDLEMITDDEGYFKGAIINKVPYTFTRNIGWWN